MFRKSYVPVFAVILIIFFSFTGFSSSVSLKHYKSAVVFDPQQTEFLFEDHAHDRVIPASLVKMMVLLVAMEKAEKKEIRLTDRYQVSSKASKIGGHQVFLKEGETFEIQELLKAIIMGSANDATFGVCEHIAGSQEDFVKLMNKRAVELGMKDTVFANVHGLPPDKNKGQEENYSSAHDMAILAKALVSYPFVLKYSSSRLDSFRNGSFQLLNTNHSFLKSFDGADGLKTGYHPRGAGFSMVGTAVRNGKRLISVVMGSPSARDRLKASTSLLEAAFSEKI